MVINVSTGALSGIECDLVTVEVDVSNGLPMMEMVGSLSKEVKEAQMRVRVALKNANIHTAAAYHGESGTGFTAQGGEPV